MTNITAGLRERFALHALEYPIPARANRLDFMLGALTLAALTLLALTGIVLTQFYNPSPLGAHESLHYVITRTAFVTPADHGGRHTGPIGHGGDHPGPSPDETRHHRFARQFTVATGYVAVGFLALTLLIGPANLLLRRRNPVSNYLSRDVGTWAAIGSVAHVIFGLQVHGGGQIRDFLDYFVASDGSLLTNSFGLGNWTGLAATVLVVGLLAISSDFALRRLKAGPWKWLQRLNYALFALVIAHAVFYGALLRVTSTSTLLLGLSVIGVFVGQAVGIWLWRRRHAPTGGEGAVRGHSYGTVS